MIDPLNSLAFSVHSSPGIYAVLLGSGISRSARIPTGWEITTDLVRKLAAIRNESCDPDPEKWFQAKFGKAPGYSDLLDLLARTPAERRQLLSNYWEASETEREEGAKQPTSAHRAIAALVAKGFIRVVVTTNFDRLMEIALADAGVTPTVISTPDQAEGALPLIHTKCLLFKIHGDYLDSRILNTPEELETYSPVFSDLLDRIFDEFGLIVCGWSAEWDTALRNAIFRAKSRRFTTYWAIRSKLGVEARKLLRHRDGQLVKIADADTFFGQLREQVESLESFSRQHPLSTEVAVATLKRYLAEDRYRIQYEDLISDEVARLRESLKDSSVASTNNPAPVASSFTSRVARLEELCNGIVHLGAVSGKWAREKQIEPWVTALEALANVPIRGGYDVWLEIRRYPATLLLYAIGITAVESGNITFVAKLLNAIVERDGDTVRQAAQRLPPICLFSSGNDVGKLLVGREERAWPFSDWLYDKMREPSRRVIYDDSRYEASFDKWEILLALACGFSSIAPGERYWVPPGRFSYRKRSVDAVLGEIGGSLDLSGNASDFVKSGIFGSTVSECKAQLARFTEFAQQQNARW